MGNKTRDEIVNAAVNLFQKNGYRNTSVDEIVKEINKTKYSFYRVFDDKEEILYIIHESIISDLLSDGERIVEKDISVEEKIGQLIGLIMNNMQNYLSYVTVFLTEMQSLTGERLADVVDKRNRFFQIVYNVLSEGIAKGNLRADLNPKMLTLALLGMCNWMYTWFSPEGEFEAAEIGKMFLTLFLEGASAKK
ncbi:TetR/AcrR family transcriptional regulator [Neobacillus mesonae]|uniref:TetR/AcrR family transcriptional regulator n=1 Tax=Neobacillus mesonae TaxID=1193713 RepID=UPI00203E3925|nr:TetR/AcrR family transcriptional regulator [Neobacillus mesonae]MCM3568246.1 TetR/AcrR family transcriptional regulator [Neobacillus mesonae]